MRVNYLFFNLLFKRMFKKLILIISGLLLFTSASFSQKKKAALPFDKNNVPLVRCATEQRVQMLFRAFPERKLLAEKLAKIVPDNKSLRMAKRMESIVYLPVVFHIVLPNPYLLTDQVIASEINVMNTDFGGLNADSTNIPAAFQAVRGHSQIRFILAKRTPDGKLTDGIDRVYSSTTGNPNNIVDSIKRSSLGGADAWDPASYINIWVGKTSNDEGVLGYTQIPGSGSLQDDGVFCNILGFGVSDCNVSIYNKGRTVVHELGHYFGLFHIWGDDENLAAKCSGDDFRSLIAEGSTYTLPTTLYNPPGKGNTPQDIGDTPNQAVSSSSCYTGIVTDSCSAVAPGIMYQDYMDYTPDDCYSLFTKKQVDRMEYVLNTYRTKLLTSLGATPPSGAATLDAAPIYSVNPGGIETIGCSSVYHPSALSCAGNLIPKVLIQNKGLNTITSITVGYVLNNGTPVTQTVNTTLTSGQTQIITFSSVAVATGNSTFKFFTKNVNGSSADQVPSNDTLSASLFVPSPLPLPISQGFESSLFPPAGWVLINPNNDVTWQRTSPGSNSNYSMYMDNYDDNPVGNVDELRTPKLNLSGNDPVVISFDLAYKNYPDISFNDSLQVLISTDCGATFKTYFNKGGAALATAGSSDAAYVDPAPGDWKNQKITVNSTDLNSGSIIVSFKNVSDYGNNIYIDNINIKQETSRDLTVIAVNPPSSTGCIEPIAPVATVKNVGFSTITAFNVNYQIDNGAVSQTTLSNISLAADSSINITLSNFAPTQGQHTITVYSAQPVSSGGTGDESPNNDTIRKSFFITANVSLPVTEGFENPVFPPTNWSIENPDGGITWQRTTAAAKTGGASMVINNYNSPYFGTTDKFISSQVSGTSAYDSIFLSFDYAYAAGTSATLADSLQIQVTTDCGQTFTTVWQNYGTALQTTPGNSGSSFVPSSTDWQTINLNLFNAVANNDFQVYFVFKGNKQNNLYIDNINIYGITVPARLKQQGYLIYPNPFHDEFIIRNYHVPVTLQAAHIYTSAGQLVWAQNYYGKANTEIPVDLSNVSPGVYFLKLQYTDKMIVQKIVKQ